MPPRREGLRRQEKIELNVETKTNRNRPGEVTRKVDLKLHDKKGALSDLGRRLGMFVDKTEVRHEVLPLAFSWLRTRRTAFAASVASSRLPCSEPIWQGAFNRSPRWGSDPTLPFVFDVFPVAECVELVDRATPVRIFLAQERKD